MVYLEGIKVVEVIEVIEVMEVIEVRAGASQLLTLSS
jgi:hypothetical protein